LSEEVLCLVTDRARAATIAGDLTEEAAVRGPLWFVAALAGVLLAMFFAAFSAARRHTLGLLVKGFVVWSLIYAGVRVAGALSGLQPAFTTGTEFAALPLAAQLYLAAA